MKLKTRLFIALVTIGVVLTVMGVRDWICLSKPVKDITEMWDYDYTDLKVGDHVCMDVTLVVAKYAVHVETRKTYGVTTSERETGGYYLLPFCQDTYANGFYDTPYLIAKIPSRYDSVLDSQIKKTEAWWNSDDDFSQVPKSTVHLDGKIIKMSGDLKDMVAGDGLEGSRA